MHSIFVVCGMVPLVMSAIKFIVAFLSGIQVSKSAASHITVRAIQKVTSFYFRQLM
jgi:hypothetical protein